MNRSGGNGNSAGPVQIRESVNRVLGQIAPPDSRPAQDRPVGTSSPKRGKRPLLETGFTPIPRVLDDLAIGLGRRDDTRLLARVLPLVVMDLARYTDNANADVIVTNNGIAERRGIGLPAVKATIKLLMRLGVLTKEEPSFERRRELQRVPGGFSGNRRRLIWNPQSEWRLPDSEESFDAIGACWNDYYRRADRKD